MIEIEWVLLGNINVARHAWINYEKFVFVGDLLDLLEYKRSKDGYYNTDVVRRVLGDEYFKLIKFNNDTTGFKKGVSYLFLNQKGMKMFLSRSRKPKAGLILQHMGGEVYTPPKLETSFGMMLQTVFSGVYNIIDQYTVLNFRVDFYIKELNLVIEYDEQHHNTITNKKNDVEREAKIIEHLECEIIRVKQGEEYIALNKILKNALKNNN